MMSQSDFESLVVNSSYEAEAHAVLSKNKDQSSREVYVPVNFIRDEAAFEAANKMAKIPLDVASEPVLKNMYEPVRCLNNPAPPKLFYRTFWRSAARRILELSGTEPMARDKILGI